MINFWHKHLIDITDRNAGATLKLPPAAKIQTGDSGVYPWSEECKRQVAEMGRTALAHSWPIQRMPAKVTPERILEAVAELRELVAHNAPPIEFKARRLPRTCGADLD